MSATTPPGDDLTPELIALLETACDRFEAAWQAGARPALEDHLAALPAGVGMILFRELMTLELVYRRRGGERPEPDEYRARFPAWGAAVDASFAELLDHAGHAPTPVLPQSAVPREDCDRNLLFGVLALQMDLIGRDALVDALNVWGRDKEASLASILVAQGALDHDDRVLLEPMVARHIHMHGDDPARSLAALSSVTTAREALAAVDDFAVHTSLTRLGSGLPRGASDHGPTEGATAPGPSGGEGATSRAVILVGTATGAGGRFRILRVHDRGALGVVYVARDRELHREVALKQIKDEHADDAQRRARFVLEAEITGGLEHPGIVPVYGLGQDDSGRPFYAMRFIRGDNLKNAIEAFHRTDTAPRDPGARALELRRLLGRFLDVCNAVAYAHSRGVLHRDLKPGNIMLGEYGETLVVDWGLAKAVGRCNPAEPRRERMLTPELGDEVRSTETGDRAGTPAFMSPEQAAGRHNELGPATDVYSLGATLYCLLTGKPPFAERDLVEVLRKVAGGEYRPPRAVNIHVDRALDAICCKAMALKPEDRYSTARALADDIEHWLADEPVAALPESSGERFGRWLRRHRTWARAAAAALLLVALISALAAGFVNQERRQADKDRRDAIVQRGLAEAQRRDADTHRRLAEEQRREADKERGLAEERQREADTQRLEAERRLARLALDQGLNLCAQGDSHRGLIWLARALQIAPADADDLRHAIRMNLDAWSLHFHRLLKIVDHDSPVQNVAFSPDGKILVTASTNTIQLWDAATLKPIGLPLPNSSRFGFVNPVSFSPDGKILVTASSDGTVRLWDTATLKLITPPLPHPNVVTAVTFRPDGKVLATAGYDATVRLFDTATLDRIGNQKLHEGPVLDIAFSPDGKVLATASDDRTVRLWDATSLTPLGTPLQNQRGFTAVTFSPDGKVLATASHDRTVRLWDVTTLMPLGTPLQHQSAVSAVTFSPDGKVLATASHDRTVRLWDAANLMPLGTPMQHQGAVLAVAYSPDGKILATASEGRTARLWDATALMPIGTSIQNQGTVLAVTFSPDGKFLATLSEQGRIVQILDAATLMPILSVKHEQGMVNAVTFSPDRRVLATAYEDGRVQLWDAVAFRPIPRMNSHSGPVLAIAFRPDGKVLATAGSDATVRLWDAATLMPLGRPIQHQGAVNAVTFSPDGKILATASGDQTVRLWDAATLKPLGRPIQHQGAVNAVTFSPDGKVLATASGDQTVRLWDAATLMPLGTPIQHQGAVNAVTFSPDGKVLATASGDHTARLWDLAAFKPIGPPLQHQGGVYAVTFSPDGKVLATASDDTTVRLWDVPTPVAGDAGQIVLWSQVLSAMRLDTEDATSFLGARDWYQRCEELGRSQASLSLIPRSLESEVVRHRRMAAHSESLGQWIDVHWHLDRLIAALPGDGSLHARRGDACFHLGRWAEADEDYGKALQHGALGSRHPALYHNRGIARAWLGRWAEADADIVMDLERRVDVFSWHAHALLRLHLGDLDGYRKACAQMLERFDQSAPLYTLKMVTVTCSQAPEAVADLARPLRLAEAAVARDPKDFWSREVLGRTLYRAGRSAEAVKRLGEAVELQNKTGNAWHWLFLAMAHQDLESAAEARAWLDKATAWLDEELAKPQGGEKGSSWLSWNQRLELVLLRREAEALINDGRPLYLPANVFQEDPRPARPPSSGN